MTTMMITNKDNDDDVDEGRKNPVRIVSIPPLFSAAAASRGQISTSAGFQNKKKASCSCCAVMKWDMEERVFEIVFWKRHREEEIQIRRSVVLERQEGKLWPAGVALL